MYIPKLKYEYLFKMECIVFKEIILDTRHQFLLQQNLFTFFYKYKHNNSL